jgi:hypothetical protein
MRDMIHKFKFKDDPTILFAPESLQLSVAEMGFKTGLEADVKSNNTLVFVNDKEEFLHFLKNSLSQIGHDSVLWIAYPKQSSKIKTNINRDILWQTAEPYGVTAVSAISIDETWSALRLRPLKRDVRD